MAERSPGRPGSGGRLPKATPYTAASATAALTAEFGEPHRISAAGAQLLAFERDPDGDGIVLARLSGQEVQAGETAVGQIQAAQRVAHAHGRRERLIVVTLCNSGGRDYELRPDFDLIEQSVAEGWCRWTSWRDLYRVEREPLPGERFFLFLRETGTELLLDDLGRPMEWERDRLTFRIKSAVGAEHRYEIKRLTHGALKERWLFAGRGWAGSKRFGFRRNPLTRFLEVDPEQWDLVLFAHTRYAQITDGRRGGVRALARELDEQGCELHPDRVRKMLSDRIYVDGTWTASYEGVEYPQRPIQLERPVPEEVFQRNQELLALRRGKNTRTPQGEFCLNAVELVHAGCGAERDAKGRRALLRGRIQGRRPGRDYAHSPWTPRPCWGFRIARDDLDPAVLSALRELASCSELLQAWEHAEGSPRTPLFLRGQHGNEQALRLRRRALSRQRARLERYFLDRLAAGEELNERDFGELLEAIRTEENYLDRRLDGCAALAAFTPPRVATPTSSGLQLALNGCLTDETPDDPDLRVQRQALVQLLLDRAVVHETEDGLLVELDGPLGPPEAEPTAVAG